MSNYLFLILAIVAEAAGTKKVVLHHLFTKKNTD